MCKRALLNFAIQAFSTSLYFSNSQNFSKFPEKREQALKLFLKSTFYALPLATQQYIKGAAFPAARLLGPNNINNTYSNLE